MDSLDDYDHIFERLHDKHAPKIAYGGAGGTGKVVEPEYELITTVAYSAFVFGLSKSIAQMSVPKSAPSVNAGMQIAAERGADARSDADAFSMATSAVGGSAESMMSAVPVATSSGGESSPVRTVHF